MQAAIVTVFLALSVSAPWVFKKWGTRGEWAWGLATMVCLLIAIWLLSHV